MLIEQMVAPVLSLPRLAKRAIALAVDACLCVLTVWLAFALRLGEWVPLSGEGWPAAIVSLVIALPIFVAFGLYRAVFRYVSWDALITIAQAVLVYGIIYSAVFTAFAIPGVPRTVGVIQPVLLFIALGGSRALSRYILGGQYRRRLRRAQKKNVLIYGAGSAGRQLATALADTMDTRPVAFVDDETDLQGSVIGGLRVHSPKRIRSLVEQLDVSEIFLAIPSATRARRNDILQLVRTLGVAVRTLPGLLDLAHGRVTVSDIKPLEIEDILGRDPVPPDMALMEQNIRDKTVLVTGAGGSIGSELCRQIFALGPRRLVLVDANEYALYGVHRELSRGRSEQHAAEPELVPLLASVCDEERMRRIFAAWRPHTVYHAAAYKHVPLVEHNLIEGVRNNALGTFICARLAQSFETTHFVLVSTDKAVRPTNVMGASKRLAEMMLQALAAGQPKTCFSMVRFGNVLGSSGSVVPVFRQQITSGGPVTVTHREITRYFMTIPEAAQLVIQAAAMAKGGEVFVLDMGEPVRIFDLAVRMIELSGLKLRDEKEPDGDIDVVFTGLRPGEKLYEELLVGENPTATNHPRIMMARDSVLPLDALEAQLKQLQTAVGDHDAWAVREILRQFVPEYQPAVGLVDWVVIQEQSAEGIVMTSVNPRSSSVTVTGR